jgi:putative endonuclease
LRLLSRNYRTPGRGGGEIDLICASRTAPWCSWRCVSAVPAAHGGAAASIGHVKQQRIVFAARHYLMRLPSSPPPCRFDVIVVEPAGLQWLQGAFDAG